MPGKINGTSAKIIQNGNVGMGCTSMRKIVETRKIMACRLCQNDFFRDSCIVTATKAFHEDVMFLRRRFYEATIRFLERRFFFRATILFQSDDSFFRATILFQSDDSFLERRFSFRVTIRF